MIHNCAKYSCQITPTRRVRQEGYLTETFADELTHGINPDDIMLNLAQLRSAQYLQQFQPMERYPGLGKAEMIEVALANRLRIETEMKQKKVEAENKKANIASKKEEAARKKADREKRQREGAITANQAVSEVGPSKRRCIGNQ